MIEAYQERYLGFKGQAEELGRRGVRLGWIRAGVFSLGFLLYLAWDMGSGALACLK